MCIKQVCCWEKWVFHVSRWESRIFLSMCLWMLYAPLCGSVLFPAASPDCEGCSWLLPCAGGRTAVGSEAGGLGATSLSGILPGLQLYCRRAVFPWVLCRICQSPTDVFVVSEVMLDAWIVPLVSADLQCLLKRIPFWEENSQKAFEGVVLPCTWGTGLGRRLVALRFSACPLERGNATNLTCAWLGCGRKIVWLLSSLILLKVREAFVRETVVILMWRFCTWVIFFVPLRFWKYKRRKELYIVVCVNSTSHCLNPCAKCPLWMLQGGRGKAAVSAVVIIDPLKRAALILHVTASWKFR